MHLYYIFSILFFIYLYIFVTYPPLLRAPVPGLALPVLIMIRRPSALLVLTLLLLFVAHELFRAIVPAGRRPGQTGSAPNGPVPPFLYLTRGFFLSKKCHFGGVPRPNPGN